MSWWDEYLTEYKAKRVWRPGLFTEPQWDLPAVCDDVQQRTLAVQQRILPSASEQVLADKIFKPKWLPAYSGTYRARDKRQQLLEEDEENVCCDFPIATQ